MNINDFEVIIIGAGAAGLMAAWQAGIRGKRVLLIEKENKIGKKIRISGGGRCNFTNRNVTPENYISSNPHFCKSALKQYSQYDFIDLVESYNIDYYEKTLGQLFCTKSSQQIIDMLFDLCNEAKVVLKTGINVKKIEKNQNFILTTDDGSLQSGSLILASGGLSIPKMGATGFAYEIAKQFGHQIVQTEPALVPLLYPRHLKDILSNLSGISFQVRIYTDSISFKEKMLLTHVGFSGPSILQISSYLKPGDMYTIDLIPHIDINDLDNLTSERSKQILSDLFPKRFNQFIRESDAFQTNGKIDINKLKSWKIPFNGTVGYSKAEVTRGGVDVNEISSKTMESKRVEKLFIIGEALDVTGHLGGFNFQWAWSSGFVAGQNA